MMSPVSLTHFRRGRTGMKRQIGTAAAPADLMLRARSAALEIAAKTGVDARTALRALLDGADVIRPLRMREALRPIVAEYRARLGLEGAS